MKINKKKLLAVVLPIFLIGLVVAGAVYYNMFNVTLNVNQPISVTGDLTSEVPCDTGDTCTGTEAIRVTNTGDEDEVVIVTDNSGDNIGVNYVGVLELTKKDTTTWLPSTDPNDKIEIIYTVVGDTFEFTGVPEGYTLIYYKDEVVGLEGRLANPRPAIIVTSGIGSLAQIDDANIDELANYTQSPDFYDHAKGAKLWVVLTEDINDGTLDWGKWDEFYFETDLVYYFANGVGEITVPANSFIEFYPQFEVNQYASDGPRTIQITVA